MSVVGIRKWFGCEIMPKTKTNPVVVPTNNSYETLK